MSIGCDSTGSERQQFAATDALTLAEERQYRRLQSASNASDPTSQEKTLVYVRYAS